ncbi:hypothetical protein HZU73_08555 [Apis mellifera caucasica]|nr:hypothetical protein HZU73_08555 [Apis mellifera caucasica]KAG9433324.1 hypothetical protein HZU67_05293 [Apis mellifera carnica]
MYEDKKVKYISTVQNEELEKFIDCTMNIIFKTALIEENNKDVSAAAMPENAQTESVVPMMFDNFVLKRWLRSIGPVRRSEVLKKLKTDLENLGLSRKQVHRGLMQLATKPHVVLTRQPLYRKCGLKNLENERENKIVDNYRMIDVQKLKNIEWIVEQKDKHIKRTNSVKAYEDSLIKNNRQLFIDGCKDKKESKVRQVIFAETIANTNINNKSKEIIDNKNTKTIDLVEDRKELKFRQDIFTETIANLKVKKD